MLVPTTDCSKKRIKQATIISTSTYFLLFSLVTLISKTTGLLSEDTLNVLYVFPICSAFVASLWAARKSKSFNRLWRLMAIGVFFWLTGSIISALYAVVRGPHNIPFPSIADIVTLAYLPIIIGIMISLGRIRSPFDSEKKQFLVNVSIAALTVFLLAYRFMLLPKWYADPQMDLLSRLFVIAPVIIDWITFVSLLIASRRFFENRVEGWVILLITGGILCILSDIPIYITGYPMNPLTMAAMSATAILMACAAIDEVTEALIGAIHLPQKKLGALAEEQVLVQNPLRTLLIPLIANIVIPAVWLASIGEKPGGGQLILVIISTLIITLSIYRNHLLASDNAILFTKALRDNLTGLNNHRYFQEVLSKTVLKANRTKKPFSLLVADIDDFAEFNNIYGHVIGDKALTIIAKAISSRIREADEACRLSGDEFSIILPKTGEAKALTLAEAIKKNINKSLTGMFPEMSITVTIGISTYPTLAKDKDELLQTADGALYWGKMHGKNSVLLYDPKVVQSLSAEERAKKVEEAALVDMVRSLAKAVDARDPYTQLHSKGVSDMARRLATYMKLDKKTISMIEIAGMLHDVGKIGIPDHILNKPGRLSDQELVTIKTHPELSAQIIKSTSLQDIIPAVRAHHERWDGNGYPSGIKGELIPMEARILAIADTFDAMTTDRPYRKALSISDALSEISRCAGTQFDPDIVKHFLAMFAFKDSNASAPSLHEGRVQSSTVPPQNLKLIQS